MDLNFYLIIVYGYILIAGLLFYFFNRDRKNKNVFLGRHPRLAFILLTLLSLSIITALYSRFIEPNWLHVKRVTIPVAGLTAPLKVAVIADLHVGEYKKTAWIQKVTNTITRLKPDLVIMAGDYTVNDGSVADESIYLAPLKEVATKFPTFAILGNHEYGYRGYGYQSNYDKSNFVRARFKTLKIPLLVNALECPKIQGQIICLFGQDDVYREQFDFSALQQWAQLDELLHVPLINISHNPDGILYWPNDLKKPSLEISGHTHGGQLWLPWFGPLGRVDVRLGTMVYRWLNYWQGIPIFTTVGTSESGAPLRLFTPPEVAILNLIPLQQ